MSCMLLMHQPFYNRYFILFCNHYFINGRGTVNSLLFWVEIFLKYVYICVFSITSYRVTTRKLSSCTINTELCMKTYKVASTLSNLQKFPPLKLIFLVVVASYIAIVIIIILIKKLHILYIYYNYYSYIAIPCC